MPDLIDAQTELTAAPLRDSGHDQNADMSPHVDPEALDSIDKIFEEETGEKPPKAVDPSAPQPEPKKDETDDDTNTEVDSIPDPKTAEGETPAADDVSDDSKTGAAADGEEADSSDSAPKEKDDLDKIELPPHTSTKAADSFNAIKEKAREQITAKDAELAELREKVTVLESKEAVTPEEKKELEDLRRFRASAEIERDPKFQKEFQERIESNDKQIYDKLTEAGMTEKQVAQIKEMGGPTKLSNWDAIYEHLSPSQKRVVDARLTENENLLRDRDSKIKEAKENVDQFLQERETTSKVKLEAESKIIEDTANEMLGKVAWSVKQDVPKDATPEQKAAIEAANKFTDTQIKTLEGLLVDRSAANHATMAVGTVQALHFRQQLETATTELKDLRESNTKLQKKLDKIKKSGASTLTGAAPTKPVKETRSLLEQAPEDALDAHRRELENA
jgi:hypothetical protein